MTITGKDSGEVEIDPGYSKLTQSAIQLSRNVQSFTTEQVTELKKIIQLVVTPDATHPVSKEIIEDLLISTFKILLNQNMDDQQADAVLTALANNEDFLSWFDQLPENELNSYFAILLSRHPDQLYQFLNTRYGDNSFNSIVISTSLQDEVKLQLASLYLSKINNDDALQFVLSQHENHDTQKIWQLYIKYRDKNKTMIDYMNNEESQNNLLEKVAELAIQNVDFALSVLCHDWSSSGLEVTQAKNILLKHILNPTFKIDNLDKRGLELIFDDSIIDDIANMGALIAIPHIKNHFKDYLLSGKGNDAIYKAATQSLSSFLFLLQLSEKHPELKQVTDNLENNIAQFFKTRGRLDFKAIATNRQIKTGDVKTAINPDVVIKLAKILAKKGDQDAYHYLSTIDPVKYPPSNENKLTEIQAYITQLEASLSKVSRKDLLILKNYKLQAMAKNNHAAVATINQFLSTHLKIKAQFNSLVIEDHKAQLSRESSSISGKTHTPQTSPSSKSASRDSDDLIVETHLTYLHNKIAMEHLDEDGFFLAKDKRAAAIAKFKNNEVPTLGHYKDRISDKEFGYTIIKLKDSEDNKDHYYAIYSGEHTLGAGAFGKVKLIQDLESGELAVVKIQNLEGRDDVNLDQFSNEHSLLKKTNQAVSEMVIRDVDQNSDRKNKQNDTEKTETAQAIFAMKLGRGEDLYQCLRRNAKKPYYATSPMQWLRLPLATIDGYNEDISSKGLSHRDIKPPNMLYENGKIKIIDLGGADIAGKETNDLITTLPFWAPELRKAYFEGRSQIHDELSEVFSLGKTIAWVMGFATLSSKISILDKTSKDYYDFMVNGVEAINLYSKDHPNLALAKCPPALREVMIDFLARMTHPDRMQRPSLYEAHKFFEQIAEYHLTAIDKVRKVAIFDIDEYLANPDKQIQINKALRQADIVYLADLGTTKRSQLDYLKVIAALEKENINVERKCYSPRAQSVSNVAILATIKDKIQKNSPQHVNSYVYVTTEESKLKSGIPLKHAHAVLEHQHQIGVIISAPNKKEAHYKSELYDHTKKQLLTTSQFELIVTTLKTDRERLIKKYAKTNADVNKRVAAIMETIDSFETNIVTHTQALSELTKLQQKMIHTSNINKAFENWFPTILSGSASTIEKLKEDLQKPPSEGHHL